MNPRRFPAELFGPLATDEMRQIPSAWDQSMESWRDEVEACRHSLRTLTARLDVVEEKLVKSAIDDSSLWQRCRDLHKGQEQFQLWAHEVETELAEARAEVIDTRTHLQFQDKTTAHALILLVQKAEAAERRIDAIVGNSAPARRSPGARSPARDPRPEGLEPSRELPAFVGPMSDLLPQKDSRAEIEHQHSGFRQLEVVGADADILVAGPLPPQTNGR